MRKGRIQENTTEGGVHFIKVCVSQSAPSHHNVDPISCLQVHNEVEGPGAPTGMHSPGGMMVFQKLPPVPSRMQLGNTGVGDRQDGFHIGISLRREGGGDQVAPVIWRGEDPYEEPDTGELMWYLGRPCPGYRLTWIHLTQGHFRLPLIAPGF